MKMKEVWQMKVEIKITDLRVISKIFWKEH